MTPFGLYVVAAHAAGDFLLQPDWMTARKLDEHRIRALHVAVYTASFMPVAIAAPWSFPQAGLFLALVAGGHYIIDSNRWAEPSEALPGRPLWFDQAYHLVCLGLAVAIVEGAGRWSA